jgi:uncharacterized cysteine cluster protein YcgN (CxxCxxCC family)
MSFWKAKTLEEMTAAEWESLCDGCARCCLIKLQDADTDEVHYTALACNLLDLERCRCTRYPARHELVPDCIQFTPALAATLSWLPDTCAYRLLAEGLDLPDWHPLVSGRADSVHAAGISVRGRVIPVRMIPEDEHEDYLIDWVGT